MTLHPKYCTQPRKIHASSHTLRAVLAYLELETRLAVPAGKAGAVGTQSNNFVVAEYPEQTGDLQVVVYNQLNGKFHGGRYTPPPDGKHTEKYEFKDSKQSGAALLFALMPAFWQMKSSNESIGIKSAPDNGFPIWTPPRETAPFSATTFTGEPAMHQVSPTGGV